MNKHSYARGDRSKNGTAAEHGTRGPFEKFATVDGRVEWRIGRNWVGHPPEVSMGKMVYVKAGLERTTRARRKVEMRTADCGSRIAD
jgi:hypothetical protein